MITSAASSCTDPWSSSGGGGYVEEEDDDGDVSWVQEDDVAVVPKLEPMEDEDINMADLEMKESVPPETPSATSTPAQAKRPRGRPRKHPKPTPESQAKITKGRSKTGCITCRKRKKKCDEAKPGCMNCEKNSVQCEGYPEKTIWKSGKEKAEEEGDQNSAFKKMLLPIALHHTGLMHSILALSGKHIDYASSYGRQFLQEHPNVDVESLEERSQYHHDEAVKELVRVDKEGDSNVVTNATYGQILCLVLQTLSDPKPTGQHRFHLQHYQRLVEESPPENGDFLKFIHEFFQYHICADELIALPTDDTRILGPDDWNLPSTVLQPAAVRLLGVSDGLFVYMSKITNIRNTIRENMEAGADIVVDFTSLYRAAEIDAGIRDWQPAWPEGDSRDLAGLLYKQMMNAIVLLYVHGSTTKSVIIYD
ncbi:putative transcriptional regulatory protein moc3 [Glarea lozoyensis 74030]|uniref:Putative transcriptional regulatory protein moc3 n=1 Tax=Glarea lozoyensis (strain ATCC 74030 / MF5533) TaxID=1104152 RepID=H0EH81_GLAL7|nr:putative transcriptional regulatory protein moc3 [Glarea lozoyensis 74030]